MRIVRQLVSLHGYWKKHPIASKDMAGTIGRFLRWQIASRIMPVPMVWPWIGSTRLVIEKGMTGATMNMYCGLHEFADMAFVIHLLRAEDRFVDIGANVGSYTVLAGGVVGARVLSVEPVPSTYRRLQTNIAVNGLSSRVQAVQCGVGANEGETLSFIADRDTCNQVAPVGYSGVTVPVLIRSLDALLEDFPAVLWKVDVEGFEEAVLASAGKALARKSLLAVEMEGDTPAIQEIMAAEGFTKFVYDPFTRDLKSLSDGKPGHNWLWVRDLDAVSKRCKEAPAVTINGITF